MPLGRVPHIVLLLASLLVAGAVTAAGLYKWTDSQGNVHYSQSPPPSGDFSKLKAPPPAPETPADTDATLQKARESLTPAPAPKGEIEEEKRIADIYAKNCEIARKNLAAYTAFRRVLNDKGESVVLDDEERIAKIKESEEMIQKYCK